MSKETGSDEASKNILFIKIRNKERFSTAGLDPDFRKGPFNFLTFASFCGNLEVVREMNVKGSSWESGLDGMNALHLATLNDHSEVVEYLLKNLGKRDPNSTCKDKLTALHIACREGSNKCLPILLKYKVFDLNAQSEGGFNALHFATFNKNIEAIKPLLDYGANMH